MDIWAWIAGLAVIIGIAAGIVQVLQYVQERREKKRQPTAKEAGAPSRPAPTFPSNLPPRGEFIGREKEKARVRETLASRWPLTCIDGIGGIGKTALALEVAGECLRASKGEIPANGIPTFDGFIWTTAKDRELALNDVLDAIARTLDYPGIAQQPLEDKQESVRKLLQSKRYLLIVDNFETVTDNTVRNFLLRLPEPSKALITSREQKLRQAWAVSLKGLEQAEALTLIRSEGRRLGLKSVEKGEERVLLRLYQATGGAPLAIKWAVGQIKQKGQSLDTVLAALHEARGDIFEQVFARSWSLLTDETQRILMVMPIFAASASRDAIEAASDVHHFALDEGLGQLVEMWLVEATDELDAAKRRYSIHPLTRAFARAKLGANEGVELSALERMSDYFLDFAKTHGGYQNWKGFDELQKELANILAVIDWCYEREQWQRVIEFSNYLPNFLRVWGYWDQRIILCMRGFEASKQAKAVRWAGVNAYWVGRTYYYRDDLDKAQAWAEESLKAMEQE
ncbi:MAG: NB-ARC domain-containing protein, partial [Anaerolineae bacterium]